MSLLFIDGFDHYTTQAQLATKYAAVEGTFTINATGRNGGNCLDFGNSNSYAITKNISSNGEIIVGFAIKPQISGTEGTLFTLYNAAGDYSCYVTRGADDTVIMRDQVNFVYASSTATLPNDVWTYVEVRFKSHATTGYCEIRINGVVDGTFTGDTQYSNKDLDLASVTFRMKKLDAEIDDIYILDTAGTVNNDFLGDVSVLTVYPDADSVNDFTATGAGTTNADRVDEVTPDDDTTYVESATVAHQERYGYGAIATSGITVHGVQVCPRARKVDDGGTRTLRALAYSVATEAVGDTVGLGTSYAYLPHIFEQDPDAVAAWTPATVNAAEFGFEIVA